MRKNVLTAKFVFPAFSALIFAFCFLPQSTTISAQELSPLIQQAIPQVEEKLRSPDASQRIEVLTELVYKQRDYDVTLIKLRYENLPASDYSAVIKSVFELDLSALDDKLASEAWWRINFLAAKFQLKEFGKNLASYLSKTKSSVQYDILVAIRSLNAVETAPEIAALPVWTAPFVSELALETLIKFRAKEAVPRLITLLAERDKYKKYYAVENLLKLDARESAPQIGKLLADEDANLRFRAIEAIGKFRARQFAPDLWRFIETGEPRQNEEYALAALAAFGDERAIRQVIVRTITTDTYRVHTELYRRLVELKAVTIIPAYIAILENDAEYLAEQGMDAPVRSGVMGVLDALQAREAIPVLRKYVRGEKRNKFLQANAATILGNLRAREAIDDLLPLLDKKDYEGRPTFEADQVAMALAKIGERRTWKKLIDFAAAPNSAYGSLIIIELNQHLDPEFWKQAEEKKVVSRREVVSIKEAAEIYSQTTGIRIVLHFEPGKDSAKGQPLAPPYKDTKGYPAMYSANDQSLIDAVRAIPGTISAGTLPQNFTFIFDDKQIHILSMDKALRWWRENILTKTEKSNARTS